MTICNPFASTKLINDMCLMLYVYNIVALYFAFFMCLYYNKNFGDERTLLTGTQHTFSDSTCYWVRLWDEADWDSVDKVVANVINHKMIPHASHNYIHACACLAVRYFKEATTEEV